MYSDASLAWADFGVEDKQGFHRRCRSDWDDVAADLANHELNDATTTCNDSRDELKNRMADTDTDAIGYACRELLAKYSGGF